MNPFQYISQSLRRKLILAAVVVEILMLSLLIWNSIRIAETHLINQTENRINELLPLLNASINSPLLDYDIASLQELLEQIVREQGVRYIELRASDKEHVISYGKAGDADAIEVLTSPRIQLSAIDLGQTLEILLPVTIATRTVGDMRVQFDSSFIFQTVGTLRGQGAAIAFIEVMLSIALLAALGRGLTRHLQALTNASRALAQGDLNARVDLQGNDEISNLASTFNTMVSTRNRFESALKSLARGSGVGTTNDFFDDAVNTLSEAFGARFAFIALLEPDNPGHVNTISVSVDGHIASNFSYALAHTPCADVIGDTKQLIPGGVSKAYPKDKLLIEMGLDAYFGAPLTALDGSKCGLVVVADTQALTLEPWMELLLDVFATRIGLELEGQESARILKESERYNRMLFEESSIGLALCRMDGSLVDANPAYCNILGRELDEIKSLSYWDITPEHYADQEQEQLRELETSGHYGPFEKEYIHKNGRLIPVQLTGRIIEQNGERFIWSSVEDISERKESEETIRRMAYHDSLTGLINRNEFENRLSRALQSAHNRNIEHALLYLDLDQFKVINDTSGHTAGDEMLRQLGRLLHQPVRERDAVARLGGDEFGVLLENCPLDQAEEIAEKLISVISSYRFVWAGRTFAVGVSIGIAPLTSTSQDTGAVLKAADMACYAAKDLGRNRTHVYRSDDRDLALREKEMHWVADIREAIDQDRFVLFRQAIQHLNGNGFTDMHEYLIRMRSSDGELVMPGSFIAAAERYNLMPAVDRWVIAAVLKHLASIPPCTDTSVSGAFINLSGTSLNDATLAEYIRAQLEIYKVDARRICFEVTETAAIANLSRATEFVEAIRALGARFALDDFGSGLSSFSYLKALPVDYLKIDGGFVKNMLTDPMDNAIVHVIQEIAKVAEIQTIAEFVEDPTVRDKLCDMGIDFAQGYFIGYPQPLVPDIEKKQLSKQICTPSTV